MPKMILGEYQSASNPGKLYQVYLGEDEVVYCTCPAWKFSGNKGFTRSCKHTEKVINLYAFKKEAHV